MITTSTFEFSELEVTVGLNVRPCGSNLRFGLSLYHLLDSAAVAFVSHLANKVGTSHDGRDGITSKVMQNNWPLDELTFSSEPFVYGLSREYMISKVFIIRVLSRPISIVFATYLAGIRTKNPLDWLRRYAIDLSLFISRMGLQYPHVVILMRSKVKTNVIA